VLLPDDRPKNCANQLRFGEAGGLTLAKEILDLLSFAGIQELPTNDGLLGQRRDRHFTTS
jgi:hypothetical protein